MRAQLRHIAISLPDQIVDNAMLHAQHPDWNFSLLAEKAGVRARRIANSSETALDLGERACLRLLEMQPGLLDSVDTLIFCTQTPDHPLPPNACALHGRLGLAEHVAAWDVNHACSGFIYAILQTQAFIAAGMARNVLIVTADTYSKLIHPGDRSARALFGDGAAATWFEAGDDSAGVMDVACCTRGKQFDRFLVPAGGCRLPSSADTRLATTDEHGNVRTLENIHMHGRDILGFVNSKIPKHVEEVLARNRLSREEIDLFVFHQASAMVLDSLTRLLRLPTQKVYQNLEHLGNTVSASIPIALAQAISEQRIGSGSKVFLCGFGAGLSWGSVVLTTP